MIHLLWLAIHACGEIKFDIHASELGVESLVASELSSRSNNVVISIVKCAVVGHRPTDQLTRNGILIRSVYILARSPQSEH